jgi:hypothetical protein
MSSLVAEPSGAMVESFTEVLMVSRCGGFLRQDSVHLSKIVDRIDELPLLQASCMLKLKQT